MSEIGNRYYSSTIARFTTPDPYRASGGPADPQSWNRYSYVQNDPVNANDPSGLQMCLAYAYSREGDLAGGYFGWCPSVSFGHASFAHLLMEQGPTGPPRNLCDRNDPTNAMKLDWIRAHRADAEKVAAELRVSAAAILGLSALESGWGTSRFATAGNNFFGLHYPAPLANGFIAAQGDAEVRVATFASYGDSAESFALAYGSLVRGITDPSAFASALQNAGKYGINPDGSKVAGFVKDAANTIDGLERRLHCK